MENAVPLTGQDELPEGFTAVDPNSSSGGSSNPSKGGEEEAKELQRKAILEQAMTPEALARLSRIKVRGQGLDDDDDALACVCVWLLFEDIFLLLF